MFKLGRGLAWLDTGTIQSLSEAGDFVKAIQNRQGLIIACLEEIAYKQGFISKDLLEKNYLKYSKSSYGEYIKRILNE